MELKIESIITRKKSKHLWYLNEMIENSQYMITIVFILNKLSKQKGMPPLSVSKQPNPIGRTFKTISNSHSKVYYYFFFFVCAFSSNTFKYCVCKIGFTDNKRANSLVLRTHTHRQTPHWRKHTMAERGDANTKFIHMDIKNTYKYASIRSPNV